jgi:integrase
LTDLSVKRIKPPATKWQYHWDEYLRNFAVRVSHTGRRVYICVVRVHGAKPVWVTLGPVDVLTISQAREMAREKMLMGLQGINPNHQRRQQLAVEQAVADASAYSLKTMFGEYLEQYKVARRATTYAQTERLLNLFLETSGLADRPASDITQKELKAYGNAVQAGQVGEKERWNRVKAVGTAYAWAIERDRIDAPNPAAHIKRPETARPKARKRILKDGEGEIVRFWNACEPLGTPVTQMFRLLLVLGQRLTETSELRWSELDLPNRVWTLPEHRTKNGHEHIVPLPPMAITILSSMRPLGKCEYVFSLDGRKPVQGISHFKRRVADAMGVDDWRLHDLRRTCATGLQRLGVRLEVTEAILNHVSGSKAGIVGIYQRHDWAEEKIEAMARWSAKLEQLIAT